MNIEHISVSRYQTYLDCEQKYKYRYHEKLMPEGETPFYFTYGKIVHKVAECYVLEKGEKTINEIAEAVLSGKICVEDAKLAEGEVHQPIPITLPRTHVTRFSKHLINIENLHSRIGFGGEAEMPFKYDLDPPNEAHVTGVIDRIIPKDDKYFIIDYKTTKKGPWRKNLVSIQYDLQLRCYGKVIQKTYNVAAENIRAALFYLDEPELVSTKFTQESLDTAEDELKEAYYQIKNKDPDTVRGSVGDQCGRCDFNGICPFYNLHRY